MSNAKIAEALAMINREIASEEERHQTLLAEAATVGKSIEEMQKAAQSLEALIGDVPAERRPARRGRRPARKTGKARSGKGRGRKASRKTTGGHDRVAPAKVLAAISGSGQRGVKRSALSGLLANRKGEEPTRKALDDALQSLLSEMSIRREGYRFVAAGEAATEAMPETVQAETEAPSDDGGQAQSEGDSIPFEEDPATSRNRGTGVDRTGGTVGRHQAWASPQARFRRGCAGNGRRLPASSSRPAKRAAKCPPFGLASSR